MGECLKICKGGQKGDLKLRNVKDFMEQILPLQNSLKTFKCYKKFRLF